MSKTFLQRFVLSVAGLAVFAAPAYASPFVISSNQTAAAMVANLLSDFTATGNVVSFQYVFGSEEYDEFVQQGVNDVFGFFLNGVNIAVVPSTTTPVSIDTINCGTNSSFYTGNNSTGGGAFGSCGNAGLNTQYDGLVGVGVQLFATGTLVPGVNHIKLAISDTGDFVYDSGVFLKAGSFVDQPPPIGGEIPEPSTWMLLGTGLLFAARAARRRRQ